MKEMKKTDNKERNLELIFKGLRALSAKASKCLTDTLMGKEDGYNMQQIFAARCILEVVNPKRLSTPLGISHNGFDLL
jgi:hypothetical protein